MRFLIFAIIASVAFAQDEIESLPIGDIEKTVEHMLEKNKQLKADLKTTEERLAEADGRIGKLQGDVNDLTKDRNNQVEAKDKALDQIDADNKVIEAQKHHIATLKYVVSGAGALLVLMLLIMVGLPSKAMPYGIIATIAIPTLIFGVLMHML